MANGALNFGIGADTSQLARDLDKAKGMFKGVAQTAQQEGQNIDAVMSKVGKAVAGAFTIAAAQQFAQQIVKVRSEIQSLEISFKTLLGSASKADALFGEIRKFAVQTPMLLKDLASGAQTLLGFGIASEEVMPILKAVGDVSMGNAQQFNALILAFSQATAAGKLMGQDLMQMINAGFNPLAQISERTGKSIGDLKEEMSQGAISADMLKQAFMDATAEGGKFHGMLEAQSKGINGALSNLQGAVDDMFNEIGESFEGAFVEGVEITSKLVKNYKEVGKVVAELTIICGAYKAALIALQVVQMSHFGRLRMLAVGLGQVRKAVMAMNAAMAANPYALAAAAIAAVGFAIYKVATSSTEAEKAVKQLEGASVAMHKEIAAESTEISKLFSKLERAEKGTKEYAAAKNTIIAKYGKYLNGLNEEIRSLKDVEGAYKAVTAAARESAKARALEKVTADVTVEKVQIEGEWRAAIYDFLKGNNNVGKKVNGKDLYNLVDQFAEVAMTGRELTRGEEEIIKQFDYNEMMGQQVVTFNGLKTLLQGFDFKKRLAAQEEKQKEAEVMFSNSFKEGADDGKEDVAATRNKAYWEEQKKAAQAKLNALELTAVNKAKEIELKKEIACYDAEIKKYSIGGGGGSKKAAKSLEDEQAVRSEQLRKNAEEELRLTEQTELEKRQAKINLMEEGTDKELAQNKLKYDRLIAQNNKREEDYLNQLKERKMLEWEQANPTATKAEIIEQRNSIKVEVSDLPEQQQAQLKAFNEVAQQQLQEANQKALDKALQDVLTYEEKRLKIAEEYARKREDLEYTHSENGERTGKREGVSAEHLSNLDEQRDAAFAAIDEEFAAKSETFQGWMNQIADANLATLRDALKQAKAELAKIEKQGNGGEKLTAARAKVNVLEKKITKKGAEHKNLSPSKRTLKWWKELRDVLEDGVRGFDELGAAVGGTAGEIMRGAAQVMTGTLAMINGIVTLTTMSAKSMEATAVASATTMATVEKASLILAVISAALQVAMAIASMFNDDESNQKEIEHLQGRIDQLQWELDNPEVMRLRKNSLNSLKEMRKVVWLTTKDIIEQRRAIENSSRSLFRLFQDGSFQQEVMRKSAVKLAKVYASIEYTADKALGADKYSSAREELEKIAQQQILINQQINSERSKKKSDGNAIKDMEQKVEELGAQAVALINTLVEDIIGGSAEDIAKELSDAFFDAFENGESAAEAWGEKVNEIVRGVMKNMLVQKFLEEPLGEVFNKYKKKWFNTDGSFNDMDAVINSMQGFAGDLNAVGDRFAQIWEELPESVKGTFTAAEEMREAAEKGITTASQDSVDELNGRMTAVQTHTYSIMESSKMLVSTTNAILATVMNIDSSTAHTEERVGRIEGDIRDLKETMNDMSVKGIKIR